MSLLYHKTHLNHHHDTVKKMAVKHKKELNEIMEPVQGMVDGLDAAERTVKIVGNKIDAQADDIDKDIGKHYHQLEQLLHQQRENLKYKKHWYKRRTEFWCN